jgi:type II secretory pathway predicted ATPase ExeA
VLPPQTEAETSLEQIPARLTAGLPAAPSACAYADFYAFVEPPFGMTPNTRFVFWGGSVSLALEQVMLGLGAREGVMVITGDTGTGKTMLCRALAHHLRQDAFLSMVVNPTLAPSDLLRQILDDFGVTSTSPHPSANTNYELFRTLEQFLVARIPQGDRAVVLIDEAHHLRPDVLEQIRLLSNLESQDAKLLQIVMVGNPDLEAVLSEPEQRELSQRVSRHCQLLPLTPAEMARYINHRMAVAQATSTNTVDDPTPVEPVLMSDGATGGLQVRQVEFTPAALAAIATFSRGVPRIINVLCDRALERGYARESRTIDGAHVLGAAVQLKLNAAPVTRRVDLRIIAATAAVAVLVAFAVGTRREWMPVAGALDIARPITLTVASVRTEPQAAELVAKLVALGLPAFDRRTAANGWHRPTVGPYASVDEARTAERQISGVGLINEPVLSYGSAPSPARVVPIAATGQANAVGANGALTRLALLTVGDRASLLLELRDAGVEASTQSADANTLVIEVGPVTGAIPLEDRTADASTPCIAHVSIEETARPNVGRFVRLRIGLRSACNSQRRAAGRRVYIDFAPSGSSSGQAPVAPMPAPAPAPKLPSRADADPAGTETAPPARITATTPDAEVLIRARALAQVPDVRALMRLRDDLARRAERSGQLESDDYKQLLEAVDRYTNDARALQLQIDGRGFRGPAPGVPGAAGRSGPRDQ